jgi:hypothetical protein
MGALAQKTATFNESWPCYVSAGLIIITVTYLHFFLTVPGFPANLELLTELNATKPYGQRVLVPLMVRALPSFLRLEYYYAFIECIFLGAIYQTIICLGKRYFSQRLSHLVGLIFLSALPTLYVINYYFCALHLSAAFYYPYDVPAIFFVFLSLYLSVQKRWGLFYLSIVMATLNRESSIINVLLPLALYWNTNTKFRRPVCISFLLYVVTRAMIEVFLLQQAAGAIMMFFHEGGETQLSRNLALFFHQKVACQLLAELLFLPVFFVLFSRYIPRELHRLHIIAVLYGIALFYFSFIIEARVWQEVVALLYLPVIIGARNWLTGRVQVPNEPVTGFQFWERYLGLFLMLAALSSFPLILKIF